MIKEVEAGSSVPILRQRSMTKYGTPEAVAVGAAPLKVYHERQEAQRCAIHTVNNLVRSIFFLPSIFFLLSLSPLILHLIVARQDVLQR